MMKARRWALVFGGSLAVGLWGFAGILKRFFENRKSSSQQEGNKMSEQKSAIHKKFPLSFQWPTQEPFLFCVHHYDYYPKGNGKFGPDSKHLQGRNIGSDFEAKDGFRMYHGDEVPGFPVHPHRGFETITIVRKGYVDHADSLGAAGRYGQGDVQWMTAGSGVQHSEMFPLLKTDGDNTVELFQIWLNLPRKSKMVAPHFKMLWSEEIPKILLPQTQGEITLIAGEFAGKRPPLPPPDSWAAQTESSTQILLVKLNPGAAWTLPAAPTGLSRSLYFFEGDSLTVGFEKIQAHTGLELISDIEVQMKAPASSVQPVEFLVLQSKPIGEPVVQHGPFVMNSQSEIIQTFKDYQQSHFGGWSWERQDMVHGGKIERFAKYPDGRVERKES